jgi:hypothetical protein
MARPLADRDRPLDQWGSALPVCRRSVSADPVMLCRDPRQSPLDVDRKGGRFPLHSSGLGLGRAVQGFVEDGV